MPSTRCCVPLCKKRGGHRFPKDPTLRAQWIKQIRRINWNPSDSSVVCFDHFAPEDYITSTWRGGYVPLKKTLQKRAVPSIFPWTKAKDGSETGEKQKERHDRKQLLLIEGGNDNSVCEPSISNVIEEPVFIKCEAPSLSDTEESSNNELSDVNPGLIKVEPADEFSPSSEEYCAEVIKEEHESSGFF